MRVVAQRVTSASVTVAGEVVGSIGRGLMLLVGVADADTQDDARSLAAKVANLRIFPDDSGKMNLSVLDVGGQVLAVSQFTLYGEVARGRRPSFTSAAPPDLAEPLFESLVGELRATGLVVETGEFGARMAVELVKQGPVTILIEAEGGRIP